MDQEAVIRLFARHPPRRVCLKQDSPEEGVGFHPLGIFGELVCCGGLILAVLMVLSLFVGEGALWIAGIVTCILAGLGIFGSVGPLIESFSHRRLARYGVATIGRVTSREVVHENDGTPAPPTRVIIEYEFYTQSGERLMGKRDTISGWFKGLEQNGPIVIVYLPERPDAHEPYNSLRYRVCT